MGSVCDRLWNERQCHASSIILQYVFSQCIQTKYLIYFNELDRLDPLWESVIVLCIVVRYFMSILVLQSS